VVKTPQIAVEESDLGKLAEYTANTRWLLENIDTLRERWPDKYVAVCESGKRIIDAPTLKELLGRLSDAGISADVCAIDFISRERFVLIV
jgi:hypothetical protein